MRGALLPDSGFFFALYEPRDTHHASAQGKREWLDRLPIVLPWPVLYEAVNTRFARRPGIMARFDAVVTHPDTKLLDDTPYRDDAYRTVVEMGRRGRPLSLVDAALLTFNPADFADVCRQNSVELL